MKRLLRYYEKELKSVSEELTSAINEASDMNKIICLTVRRDCYKKFIPELKPLVPADAPAPGEVKKTKEQEEQEYREWQMENDRKNKEFFDRIEAMEKEDTLPELP